MSLSVWHSDPSARFGLPSVHSITSEQGYSETILQQTVRAEPKAVVPSVYSPFVSEIRSLQIMRRKTKLQEHALVLFSDS